MKLSELISLDCRSKENKQALLEELERLPFFKNKDVEDVTVEDLEEAYFKMHNKYPVCLSYIMLSPVQNERYYTLMLKRLDDHTRIATVYGRTIFEGYAKAVIVCFAYIRKNLK